MSIPRPPSRLAIASTAAAPKLAPLSKQKDCDEPEVYEPDFTFPGAFGHCGEITAAVISGAFLVTGGVDCTLRVWCRDSLSLVHVLRGHRGSVLALAAIGSLVLSGGRDHSVRVWDMVRVSGLEETADFPVSFWAPAPHVLSEFGIVQAAA